MVLSCCELYIALQIFLFRSHTFFTHPFDLCFASCRVETGESVVRLLYDVFILKFVRACYQRV